MIFANPSAPMNAQSSSSCSLEFLRVKVFLFRRPTPLEMLDFNKTSYTDFVLARNEFLKLVGDPNESLRLIIVNYMFNCTFRMKKTLLESLRNKKKPFVGSISEKTTYSVFVLARSEFLRYIAVVNESLRLIILYYMLKYTFSIKTTLLESLRDQKNP